VGMTKPIYNDFANKNHFLKSFNIKTFLLQHFQKKKNFQQKKFSKKKKFKKKKNLKNLKKSQILYFWWEFECFEG
jgi:hypothetical protein